MPARDLGQAMEALACRYLEERGLRLLARNYATRRGELDLVMRDGAAYVFVEVRYRRHAGYGSGAESVDRRKQQRITACALHYLMEKEGTGERPCRFDVVAIAPVSGADGYRVEWIPNAFEFQ